MFREGLLYGFLLFGACTVFGSGEEEEPTFSIPMSTMQIIVGKTTGWDSNYVTLQLWERADSEAEWTESGDSWPGRVGYYGLAWGRGLHPEKDGRQKKEGDRRAPAGVFRLGEIYGYAEVEKVKRHDDWPYHRVTSNCLWVDDAESEFYNFHIDIEEGKEMTSWERSHRMRLNTHTHSLKLFVEHNSGENIKKGAGSAIFFHIWRHSRSRSFGCTIMSEENLKRMIAWLDPNLEPLFVLLPKSVYADLATEWELPSVE